jgi:hypothetical protein
MRQWIRAKTLVLQSRGSGNSNNNRVNAHSPRTSQTVFGKGATLSLSVSTSIRKGLSDY